MTFIALGTNYINMNNLGQISTTGYFTGPGIDPNNNGCIWSGTSYQDLSWVARKGEQAPGALDAMININEHLDELMRKAVEDLKKPPSFLTEVQQSILRCYQIERKAFEKLSALVR